MSEPTKEQLAAEQMDWTQVVLNGGPPCFALMEDGRFCGRAQRWEGHSDGKDEFPYHKFVSLADILAREGLRLREPNKCGVCAGNGKPISDRPCVCGGSGLEADEIIGLRNMVHTLTAELELLRKDLKASLLQPTKAKKEKSV